MQTQTQLVADHDGCIIVVPMQQHILREGYNHTRCGSSILPATPSHAAYVHTHTHSLTVAHQLRQGRQEPDFRPELLLAKNQDQHGIMRARNVRRSDRDDQLRSCPGKTVCPADARHGYQ